MQTDRAVQTDAVQPDHAIVVATPAAAARPHVVASDRPAPRGRAWPWVVALVLLIAAGGAFAWHRWHAAAPAAEANKPRGEGGPVPVVTAAAHQGDLAVYLNALGTVTPLNVVVVRSRVDGELISVNFKEGQAVKQNDLLATIDPRPYEATVAQARGQLTKDQALLKNAQADLEKYQAASAAITKQQIDTQAAVIQQNEGAVQADQGTLDAAQLQVTYCRIVAPFDGRIGLRRVDQGNIVHATDADGLAVITQVQPISVVFTIAQDQIPAVIRAEQAASGGMVAEAWDRDFKSKLADGRVAAIDNQVDPTTGTVRLKATFDNSQGILFPSQFTNVRLLVDTLRDATIVPAAAVQRGPSSDYVYVVGGDDTVAVRPVKIGPAEGEQVVIADGVAPGERVVTSGVDKLRAGAKVTARAAENNGGGRRGNATSTPATRGTAGAAR